MKVEEINPIIEAVYTVGNSFLGKEPEIGDLFVRKEVQYVDGVLISIALTGDFNGRCLLSFNNKSIKIIAGSMIGMEVNEIDDMVKSAVSEFCNMIMGNAATNFSVNNRSVNIGSPLALENGIDISSNIKFLGLPFWINKEYNFELYLYTEEK